MKMNRENYTRSLENIRPSEKFLAETKKLMLEEAEKSARSENPSRKPLIMKITPFAAAAACIAVIAAVSVNILNDKGAENAQAEYIAVCTETSAEVTEETAEEDASDYDTADEEAADDEDFIAAENSEEDSGAADEEIAVPAEEAEPNEPAFFAAGGDTVSDGESIENEENDASPDENAFPESADEAEVAFKHHTNYLNDSLYDEKADPNADGNDTDVNNNAGSEDHITDNDSVEDNDDDTGANTFIAPAFTKLSGGKASDYPDFSPTDTEKLREFLALVSQDEINAEVTDKNGENSDVFGENALALNDSFADVAEKLTPSGKKSFAPIFSFSVFDNVSGEVLYTVRTDGENISVQIKNGETAYFTAEKSVIDGIIS